MTPDEGLWSLVLTNVGLEPYLSVTIFLH